MRNRVVTALMLLSLGAVWAAPLRGDDRVIPPAVTKIWPVGMERGTTATFTIDGRNLTEARGVLFDSPGISAKVVEITDVPEKVAVARAGVDLEALVPQGKKQSLTLQVTADADVAPGLHWFRIRTPLGTSNLQVFDVGEFPEVHADEKAGEMQVEPAPMPATLVGTIAIPGEIDRFAFDGRSGEELVFRVTASELGSELESSLVLHRESGEVVAKSGAYENRADAVLTAKLPAAGRYTLAISDREKGGGPDYYYRVDAGPEPYLTGVFPLGVRAGGPATVAASGINLGSMHEVKVDPPKWADGWTTMPLATNDLLTIDLDVAGEKEPIYVYGTVVRNDARGAGVSFVRISEITSDLIGYLIRKAKKESAPSG